MIREDISNIIIIIIIDRRYTSRAYVLNYLPNLCVPGVQYHVYIVND